MVFCKKKDAKTHAKKVCVKAFFTTGFTRVYLCLTYFGSSLRRRSVHRSAPPFGIGSLQPKNMLGTFNKQDTIRVSGNKA